jgi:tetratricopeptide (TPR) repeat protein
VAKGEKPGDMRAWCDGNALPQEGFGGDLQIKGCTALIESGVEKPADLPRDYFNRANAYEFADESAKALADFGEAIRLKPDYAEAWYRRGAVQLAGKQYAGAIADLSSAIKIDSAHAVIFLDRGAALLAAGRFDEAIADFTYALKLEPNDPQAYLGLCRASIGKRNFGGANAACSSAIQYSRTSEATEAYNSRGDAALLLGDYAAAIADYDEALNRWPQYPEAFYGRGVAKTKKGDAAGGKDDIDAARKLKPGIEADEAALGIKP